RPATRSNPPSAAPSRRSAGPTTSSARWRGRRSSRPRSSRKRSSGTSENLSILQRGDPSMRYKVTVVGAGNVGATCAQLIAQADVADVVMVDVAADLAAGKALDMMESAPVLGFNARI